jgi:hypothetical protein
MKDKTKVYIASPYTNGNKLELVKLQIDAFHILMDLGFYPIAPLLSHYINEVRERTWKEWLNYDIQTIHECQILVRLYPKNENGLEIPSKGADAEEAEAKRLGIEFHSFESLKEMKEFFETDNFLYAD